MIIGGEHTINPLQYKNNKFNYYKNVISSIEKKYYISYTFGGYYSILSILSSIKNKYGENINILLPSYMCPSILKPLKILKLHYKFYKVDSDLFIDKNNLKTIIDTNTKIVFIIDYFGKSQKEYIQDLIIELKEKQILIIQDIVQCLEIDEYNFYGDFIFNSFRKFFPYEGSIIFSNQKIDIDFSDTNRKYILFKRFGQILRFYANITHIIPSSWFLLFLKIAEKNYYKNSIISIPKNTLKKLNKFDISSMIENQKTYYKLFNKDFENDIPKFLSSDKFCPLGLVLKVKERNSLRKYLINNSIYTPIHWILLEEIYNNTNYYESKELSNKIITIPLININENKYKYIINKILKYEYLLESI